MTGSTTRRLLLAVVLLLAASWALAQNCDQVVTDETGLLHGGDSITAAAQQLIGRGADPHVLLVESSGGNLDRLEDRYEQLCGWKAPDGKTRKSTLIVLIASTRAGDHKAGLYYGAAWHRALDDHWNRIKQDYLIARLKAGDYPGAFAATEDQLAKRLEAASSEALHPAVSTTTINQPAADYSGLWAVLKWLLALLVLGLLAWLGYALYQSWQRRKEAIAQARGRAMLARNEAVETLNRVSQEYEDYKVAHASEPGEVERLGGMLERLQTSFSRYSGSLSMDPNDPELTLADYNSIISRYDNLSASLQRLEAELEGPGYTPQEPPTHTHQTANPFLGDTVKHHESRESEPYQAPAMPGGSVFAPMTIITSTGHDYDDHERRREQREREREHEEESRERERDNENSGGSSSFSSSSDSGSGGSSSFDFGSSDSGGGGSSDY